MSSPPAPRPADGPPAISQETARSVLLLSTATFASMVAQRICDPMLPELARVFQTSLASAAQVVSLFAVVYGLAQVFYGPVGDRFGKFRVVAYATLACAAGNILAMLAQSLEVLLLARVMVAACAAAIIPLSLAWVGDVVPASRLQETLARTGRGTTLGIVCGQLLGGLFVDTLGWRWAFGFLTLLFGLAGWLLLTDVGRQRRATPAVPASPARGPGFPRQALLLVTGRWSRWVLLVALLEGAAGFGVVALWASHLHRVLGLALSTAGMIVAVYGLGGVLYMSVARLFIRRLGGARLAALGVLLLAGSAAVVAVTPWWVAAVPACMVAGFGFFMFHNTMQAQATAMAPNARGSAVAMFASCLFLGQAIGAMLGAALIEQVGSRAVIAGGAAVVLAAGLPFARALRRRELREV